ncbi:interleukin-9 [Ictidomys tridecemlineatus]|uniref:Interleukin 9 n=1 Tax=Ictidomys tridecemlineatus TaxID=43179 RepID=A0A287D266_ICTTR|nr:interleukin-9 [Ictidomys tridecemlineatus]KAG3265811.1 interleukin 9 [Ictidomys tridecemlineatus]
MLLGTFLASTLLLCSVASQRCSTSAGIRDVDFLLKKLKEDSTSNCSCSANVTSCLCLPIPSDNCSTPCFQEGLSQMTNATQKTKFSQVFLRVKRSVAILKNNKCPFFSCEQPCNLTTPGNMETFLRSLLETFQKEKMTGVKGQL